MFLTKCDSMSFLIGKKKYSFCLFFRIKILINNRIIDIKCLFVIFVFNILSGQNAIKKKLFFIKQKYM